MGCGSGLHPTTKLHSTDRTAFALQAYAAPPWKHNYYKFSILSASQEEAMTLGF